MSDELTIPDSLFPTDNALEIPTLRLDRQAETCEIPFVCFGEQKRTYKMYGQGTLHFYTDDYRFSTIYEHPEKALQYNPRNIVEPNFSLFNDMPLAFGLQAIYKKRMVARALQEKGLRVFVDLNVANKWYAYNLTGVPRGWGAFCTRGYEDRLNALEFEWLMAQRVASGSSVLFVVYGGGETVKAWCRDHAAVYVTPVIIMRNRREAMLRMARNADTGLFADTERGQTVPLLDDMLKKQVCDFQKRQLITNT